MRHRLSYALTLLALAAAPRVEADCTPEPGPVENLMAVRSADDVVLSWDAMPSATSYTLWKSTDGEKRRIPIISELGSRFSPSVVHVCGPSSDLDCTDPLAVSTNPPSLVFYQVRGVCADGTEESACPGVETVWISTHRAGIPDLSTPIGSCAMPDLLPIRVQALLLDAMASPAAGCPVIFFVDFGSLANCARVFGEFCDSSSALSIAVSDAGGVGEVQFTMRQEDVDFCNCLPSACDLFLCPAPRTCAAACNATSDLFCQVAFAAAAGAVQSSNVAFVEYGR